jgi:glycosyltransferase involved in cell wall biosynthesis
MKISVALPVYNGANYLREALESLAGQGAALDEIVVSDNCSTDATPAIIREFAARDPRIRHERSEVQLGQAENVTRSVRLCRHEWVQLLCHDDLLRPGAIDALAAVIAGLGEQECALIGHQPAHLFANDQTHRAEGGQSVIEPRPVRMAASVKARPEYDYHPADTTLGPALRQGSLPYLPSLTTAAVRRSVFMELGGFDPRWVHFDVFFWIRLVQAHGYAIVNDDWTLTRVHGQQVAVASRKNQRSYRDFRDFYRRFAPEARRRYGLGRVAYLKLRMKPVSQAAAPLVVAALTLRGGEFLRQLFALRVWMWPPVLAVGLINFYRESRRTRQLRKAVPVSLIFE